MSAGNLGTARVLVSTALLPAFFIENRIVPHITKGLPDDARFESVEVLPNVVGFRFSTATIPSGETRDLEVVYTALVKIDPGKFASEPPPVDTFADSES